MALLPDHAIVMHPGPMNRGMEISADVADSARSVIVEQVTNGVTVRMAVLYLLLGRSRETRRAEAERSDQRTVIKGARCSAASPADLLLERRGDRRDRRRSRRGGEPRSSTPTAWSRCPAWSTCTPTCASPAARTPRPSRPARRAAALGGFTAVHAMANTDPVADTAGVVEQVWRLGREAGHCDVRPVGAVTVGLARRAAGRARRDGRLRGARRGCSPTTGTACPTPC